MGAAALHALYLTERDGLEGLPWLEREGYAAYAHHVPAVHRHLDALPTHPRWGRLFGPDERAALHRTLDATPWALGELRRLPPTLVHGDFHAGNLGFDTAGELVAIDWAHVGLAPLGSDVAVLGSLLAGAPGGDGLAPGAKRVGVHACTSGRAVGLAPRGRLRRARAEIPSSPRQHAPPPHRRQAVAVRARRPAPPGPGHAPTRGTSRPRGRAGAGGSWPGFDRSAEASGSQRWSVVSTTPVSLRRPRALSMLAGGGDVKERTEGAEREAGGAGNARRAW